MQTVERFPQDNTRMLPTWELYGDKTSRNDEVRINILNMYAPLKPFCFEHRQDVGGVANIEREETE